MCINALLTYTYVEQLGVTNLHLEYVSILSSTYILFSASPYTPYRSGLTDRVKAAGNHAITLLPRHEHHAWHGVDGNGAYGLQQLSPTPLMLATQIYRVKRLGAGYASRH